MYNSDPCVVNLHMYGYAQLGPLLFNVCCADIKEASKGKQTSMLTILIVQEIIVWYCNFVFRLF